jgi:hypothetical protein
MNNDGRDGLREARRAARGATNNDGRDGLREARRTTTGATGEE